MAEITANPVNEYNYPSLNRKDLMYLQTLNSNDFPIKHFKQMDTKREWSCNLYNLDIEGSSPRRLGAYNQKIDFTNKNDDIERSNPKTLHMKLNKPEYNLTNEDIELSVPRCVKMFSNRHVDPLEPKYILPSSPPITYDVPKFIRDSIKTDDIDGTHPRKIVGRWSQRESLKKDDILKCSPKKPYTRNTFYDYINYRDVTHCEFKSKRTNNPLEPIYNLGYPNGDRVTIGPIDGNKPVVFSKYYVPDPMNLRNDDISGSNTGSKNVIRRFNGMNYIYTSTDITGAQASTLKRGIVTKRHLHPLMPNYQFLGAEELKNAVPENNPYGRKSKLEKSCVLKNKLKIDQPTKATNEESQKQSNEAGSENKSNEGAQTTKAATLDESEFEGLPFVQDSVDFDKEKYKKPLPFYGNIHDPYLIPPIEEHKKKKTDLITKKTQFVMETGTIPGTVPGTIPGTIPSLAKSTMDAKPRATENSFPKPSYAQKLDKFMADSNMRLIE